MLAAEILPEVLRLGADVPRRPTNQLDAAGGRRLRVQR